MSSKFNFLDFHNLDKRKNIGEIKEINEELIKADLNWDDISEDLKNTTFYFDYDDIVVNLMSKWVSWVNVQYKDRPDDIKAYIEKTISDNPKLTNEEIEKFRNSTEFTDDMVKKWGFFANLEGGLAFLDQDNLYENIELNDYILDVFFALYKNDLHKNIKILTASAKGTSVSKYEHFERALLDVLNKKAEERAKLDIKNNPNSQFTDKDTSKLFGNSYEDFFITTKLKDLADYSNGILIDDASHNVENVVSHSKNNNAYCILLDHYHNQDTNTGKRIFRINDLNDYLLTVVKISVKKIIRNKRLEKAKDFIIAKETSIQAAQILLDTLKDINSPILLEVVQKLEEVFKEKYELENLNIMSELNVIQEKNIKRNVGVN